MPTDEEWEKAFGRLSREESSLREEGKKLDVHHSIVGRRFIDWLDHETEKRQSICTQLKQNIGSLEGEYAKKKQIEEERFRRATAKAEGEHKNRIADIQRATARAEEVHRKRISELQKTTATAEEIHRNRMSALNTEISAKEELLREFRKARLEPETALLIIREHVDLSSENNGLARAIGEKTKKVAGLDHYISLAEENLKGLKDSIRTQQAQCKWELSAAGKALSAMSMDAARIDQQRTFLNAEVVRLIAKLAELEPKVNALRREHGALVDVTELGLKAARMMQALKTLDDEVASLKRTRDKLDDVIRELRRRKRRLENITAQVVPNMVAVGEQLLDIPYSIIKR